MRGCGLQLGQLGQHGQTTETTQLDEQLQGGLKMQDLEMRDHRNMTENWGTSYRRRLYNVISRYEIIMF